MNWLARRTLLSSVQVGVNIFIVARYHVGSSGRPFRPWDVTQLYDKSWALGTQIWGDMTNSQYSKSCNTSKQNDCNERRAASSSPIVLVYILVVAVASMLKLANFVSYEEVKCSISMPFDSKAALPKYCKASSTTRKQILQGHISPHSPAGGCNSRCS